MFSLSENMFSLRENMFSVWGTRTGGRLQMFSRRQFVEMHANNKKGCGFLFGTIKEETCGVAVRTAEQQRVSRWFLGVVGALLLKDT